MPAFCKGCSSGTGRIKGAAASGVSTHATLPNGLVCWFDFADNVTDSKGTVSATAVGSPSYADGKPGRAIVTDTTPKYVNLGNPVALRTDYLTFACWLKVNSGVTAISAIANRRPDWDFYYQASPKKFTLTINGSPHDSGVYDIINTWALVALTFDGADAKVWLNDAFVFTRAFTPTTVTKGTNNGAIGYMHDAGYPMAGQFGAAGYWDRPLTSGELTALYNSGNGLSY
jgi:hypothetical protein